VRKLGDAAPNLDAPALDEMTRDLAPWIDRLRRYAGIDRVFKPRATCSQCGALGTLSIWVDEAGRQADRGLCHKYRATWERPTVGVLVEHVRNERRVRRPA
jgi:hypothetical protein